MRDCITHIDDVIKVYARSDGVNCFDDFYVPLYSNRCTDDVKIWREQNVRHETKKNLFVKSITATFTLVQ